MDNQSNLSPVTESEVMTFASRICTTIVAHSQQQGRIESLERTLNDTTTERDHLRSENARLNQDIGETTTLADGYSRERDDALRRLHDVEGKLHYQEEMAIQKDAKVAELQGQLRQVQEESSRQASAADHYKGEFDRVTHDLGEVQRKYSEVTAQLRDMTTRVADTQAKLDKIPFAIRSHFTGETEEKPEPKPEPQTPKPETAQNVPITEDQPKGPTPWNPPVEMKPVQQEEPKPYNPLDH